ncbi:protein NDH-DEPENDENT CYCLIC ELECTRON FLOW 5-like [Aristolochia californica]|uniref:protein NDH-DEPENDENT CYCLIC ELECTRON FLOW 5-like n=1 Tax=Aristolochia californica TaxID=171875 RepID=UPI0035DDDF34
MAMPNLFLFSPSLTGFQACTNPSKHLKSFSLSPHHKRSLSVFASASTSSSPINVEYLEKEFSGHGASFAGLGEGCVVKMRTENGSAATLMLPSGLITSYKPQMWHGGSLEVLHTLVSEGEDGGSVVHGGVSVGFKCETEEGQPWSPSVWSLYDVRGNSETFIEVELMCTDAQDKVEVRNIVTLQEDLLSSELVISNWSSSSLQLMGSFVSHLTVSTPDATYAIGLEGSSYFSKPPLMSDFSIIPPGYIQRKKSGSNQPRGQTEDRIGNQPKENEDSNAEIEEEEDDNYTHLTEKMSKIYTTAPRQLTIIDRGKRNSVTVGRIGLDELYIFSPGSSYEWYGKYAYICVGPSAVLKPVVLDPEAVWRVAQYLHNPNL